MRDKIYKFHFGEISDDIISPELLVYLVDLQERLIMQLSHKIHIQLFEKTVQVTDFD